MYKVNDVLHRNEIYAYKIKLLFCLIWKIFKIFTCLYKRVKFATLLSRDSSRMTTYSTTGSLTSERCQISERAKRVRFSVELGPRTRVSRINGSNDFFFHFLCHKLTEWWWWCWKLQKLKHWKSLTFAHSYLNKT